MIQRDILQDQIKELARVLSTILGDFLGYKTSGQIQKGIEKTTDQLKAELDIDVNQILNLSNDDLKAYLKSKNLFAGHFEILAKYFYEIGIAKMLFHKDDVSIYLKKAIELLELENEISETLSFERLNLKSKAEQLLSTLP